MKPLFLILLVAIGCAPRTVVSPDSDCIGIKLSEAIVVLGLKLDKSPVVDEPPGEARALTGEDSEGHTVLLYFKREPANFSANRDWSIEALKGRTVVGIARRTPAGWEGVGEVIWR